MAQVFNATWENADSHLNDNGDTDAFTGNGEEEANATLSRNTSSPLLDAADFKVVLTDVDTNHAWNYKTLSDTDTLNLRFYFRIDAEGFSNGITVNLCGLRDDTNSLYMCLFRFFQDSYKLYMSGRYRDNSGAFGYIGSSTAFEISIETDYQCVIFWNKNTECSYQIFDVDGVALAGTSKQTVVDPHNSQVDMIYCGNASDSRSLTYRIDNYEADDQGTWLGPVTAGGLSIPNAMKAVMF